MGEILVGSGYLTQPQLDAALANRPQGVRIGEHLVASRIISEELLYEAFSLQQALPAVHLEPQDVPLPIARSLPAALMQEWRVLPFRVVAGSLHVASPEAPSSRMQTALRSLTNLELKFHLVTPQSFSRLSTALW